MQSLLREIARVENKIQEEIAHTDVQQEVEQTGQHPEERGQDHEKTGQEVVEAKSHGHNAGVRSRLCGLGTLVRVIVEKLNGHQEETPDIQNNPDEQRGPERQSIVEDIETSENYSTSGKRKSLVTAYLSEVYDKHYRLDFKWRDSENVGTFILQKTSESQTRGPPSCFSPGA